MFSLLLNRSLVGIEFYASGNDFSLKVFFKDIYTKVSTEFIFDKSSSFEKLFEDLKGFNGDHEQIDPTVFMLENFCQYRNNVYGMNVFLEKNPNMYHLYFFEFYVKTFTMEMYRYVQSMEISNKNLVKSFISSGVNHKDPFYSDFLEIKSFFNKVDF